MSTADFRQIALGKGPRNCERVFRAAISAFCTLSRPTRGDLAQLDDLALGLFDAVPADARRFACAVLCECDPAPAGLIRRLSDEPVEISAPLLVRSSALSDVDLIALIGRHGLPHARAIARRDGLNPVVASLIRALNARAAIEAEASGQEVRPAEAADDPLEDVRRQLRTIMRQADEEGSHDGEASASPAGPPSREAYPALCEAALLGDMPAFTKGLAIALGIPAARARQLAAGITYSDLLVGLKLLELSVEEAFFITAALYPAQVAHAAALRLFRERYRAIDKGRAGEKIENWRQQDAGSRRGGATVHSLASAR